MPIRSKICFGCNGLIDLFHDHYIHIHTSSGVNRYWHNDHCDPKKNCYLNEFFRGEKKAQMS